MNLARTAQHARQIVAYAIQVVSCLMTPVVMDALVKTASAIRTRSAATEHGMQSAFKFAVSAEEIVQSYQMVVNPCQESAVKVVRARNVCANKIRSVARPNGMGSAWISAETTAVKTVNLLPHPFAGTVLVTSMKIAPFAL